MKHSALWLPFFFVGLLFACARIPDGRPSAAAASAAPPPRVVRHVKVAVADRDRLSREPRLAVAATGVSPQDEVTP
jgi:hypothetical protein